MGVKQRSKSLTVTHNKLADTFFQLKVLNGDEIMHDHFEPFAAKIGSTFQPVTPQVFQINIGKLCNQSCAHSKSALKYCPIIIFLLWTSPEERRR
jgi:hypothetical protein